MARTQRAKEIEDATYRVVPSADSRSHRRRHHHHGFMDDWSFDPISVTTASCDSDGFSDTDADGDA
jgi:hypothetical protein